MALIPGTTLGPYEIQSAIGAGGMGEVYRARDTRLQRDVAVKVLSSGLSHDADRLQRFEQEARAAAALTHPNILAVFDIGQHAGQPYIVSELLEGETLRETMATGLAVRKGVGYAIQIARGLAAAHEKGIVHRDLKPDNVFVTADGQVKILDFGLAKLTQAEPVSARGSMLPTTPPATLPGIVMGTIGYMSPEQVRALPADHRTDIFALGVILYEMLAGKRAFSEQTPADTMLAVLSKEPPDLDTSGGQITPALDRIIRRCLEKTPGARFQSAHDLAFALDALSTGSGAVVAPAAALVERARSRRWLTVAAAAVALVAAVAAGVLLARWLDIDAEPAVVRFSIQEELTVFAAGTVENVAVAISPDARHVVFVGRTTLAAGGAAGDNLLWLRSVDALTARRIAGTEGAQRPFWSPDSRSIAFFADGQLKRVDLTGGSPRPIATVGNTTGGTWSGDVILFGGVAGIQRVSATGGPATGVTTVARPAASHRYPHFMPDGRRFIYLSWPSNTPYVASLDSSDAPRRINVEPGSMVTYADPGFLLFVRDGVLMAQPVDPQSLEPRETPIPVADGLGQVPTSGYAAFGVARAGALVYLTAASAVSKLSWIGRDGKPLGTIGEPGIYWAVALSRDGRRVAVQKVDTRLSTHDLWLLDAIRGLPTRFTFEPGDEREPMWSEDNGTLAFHSTQDGKTMTVARALNGSGQRVLYESSSFHRPEDWSRDGKYVLINGSEGLAAAPQFGDRKPIPLTQRRVGVEEPSFSPDGRWIAWNSNESGSFEVYAQPFPGPGEPIRISDAGGVQPRWREDGRELFYLEPDGDLVAMDVTTDVTTGATLQMGRRTTLFHAALTPTTFLNEYAVTPDGQRFLFVLPADEGRRASVNVVLNWQRALQGKP